MTSMNAVLHKCLTDEVNFEISSSTYLIVNENKKKTYIPWRVFQGVGIRPLPLIRAARILTLIGLTRAPLGYFYNAPHWGGYFEPPL